MEKNGGLMTKLNSCPENYAFSRNLFKISDTKMCKDDINQPVFFNVPDSLIDDNAMDIQNNSILEFSNEQDTKSKSDFRLSEKELFSLINGTPDNTLKNCLLPAWSENSGFSFNQNSSNKTKNMSPRKSLLQNESYYTTSDLTMQCEFMSNNISNNSHHSFEDDNSSSSVEEIFCPEQGNLYDIRKRYASRHVLEAKNSVEISNRNKDCIDNQKCSPNVVYPHNGCPEDDDGAQKSDRLMPELTRNVICLDDDEESAQDSVKESYEIIDVADSPEMPTLSPFSSEAEEEVKIKQECFSEEETDIICRKSELQCTADNILQPQVLIERISLERCVALSDLGIEKPPSNREILNKNKMKNSSNDGPEIEEIEGVRFFQFRSKQEMEEFNQKTEESGIDLDMIVPTKTTDITQIKGWRNKYFAPDAQLHSFQLNCENVNCPSDINLTSEAPFNSDKACLDSCNPSDAVDNEPSVVTSSDLKSRDLNEVSTESKLKIECNLQTKIETVTAHSSKIVESKTKVEKNPMSAFISKDLDDFLLNSSELNVSYLQKRNPNIRPIPPNAGILSLGKLKKPDISPKQLHAKRNNFSHKVSKEVVQNQTTAVKVITDSPEVLSIYSSDGASSDDDIPVAKLNCTKGKLLTNNLLPNKCVKRRKSETSSDHSQRLVLRLTKESKGTSEGYKISDLTCKKSVQSLSSSSSSSSSSSLLSSSSSEDEEELPEEFKVSPNGFLPIIQKTIFMNENEPKLLSDFLKNLNMFGTSKDVAMLVESNQSYFDEGPVLAKAQCTEALSALITNQDLTELKQKPKSRKKLKTWQKYLPKKLSKNQKLKISKAGENSSKKKVEKTMTIEDCQRGKRSIRLPARYLDSAVLAAGSEWVSPVFVDDLNKSRKQLLDVLDKIKTGNCNKQRDNSVLSDSDLDKSQSNEQKLSNQIQVKTNSAKSGKKLIKESIPKKSKKLKLENSKMLQKNRNRTLNSKKDSVVTLISDKNEDSCETSEVADKQVGKMKSSFESFPYYLPACACFPCSRTAFFNRSTKELSCFSNHSGIKNEIEKDQNNFQNYTISHENSNSVTLSIPCEENESSDVLKVPDVMMNNEVSLNDKVNEIMPDSNSKTVCSVNDDNKPELVNNSVVLNGPIFTESVSEASKEVSSTVESKIVSSNMLSDPVQSFKVNNSSVPQSSIYKSPLFLSPTGLRSLQNPQTFVTNKGDLNSHPMANLPIMNAKNTVNSNYKLVTSATTNNQIVQIPVSGNNNKQFIVLLPMKTAGSVNNVGSSLMNTNSNLQKIALLSPSPAEKSTPRAEYPIKVKPPILFRKIAPDKPVTFPSYSKTSNLKSNPCSDNNLITGQNPHILSVEPKQLTASASLCLEPTQSSPTTFTNIMPKVSSNLIKKPGKSTSVQMNNSSSEGPVPKIVSAYQLSDNIYFRTQSKTHPITSKTLSDMPDISIHSSKEILLNSISIESHTSTSSSISDKENSDVSLQLSDIGKCLSTSSSIDATSLSQDSNQINVSSNLLEKRPCELLTEHHNYSRKKMRSNRRKSPILKRILKEAFDSDIDIETIDDKFNPKVELKSSVSTPISTSSESEMEWDSNNDKNVKKSTGNTKSLQEKKRRLLLRKNFCSLKNSSGIFKNAASSREVLDRAVFAIKKFQSKEETLLKIKHRLRIHNTRLLGKFLLCLQGVKDTNIRNLCKKQVVKNLAHDWVRQLHVRLKNTSVEPSLRPKKRAKKIVSKSTPNKIKDASTTNIDYEDHIKKFCKGDGDQSTNLRGNSLQKLLDVPVRTNKKADVLVEDKNVRIANKRITDFSNECSLEIENQMDFEIDEEVQSSLDVLEELHPNLQKQSSISSDFIQESIVKSPSNDSKKPTSIKSFEASQDETFSEDQPLIIDISDDEENPIPKNIASQHSKSGNVMQVKKFPGLIPLFADEQFEIDKIKSPEKNTSEIKRYLHTEAIQSRTSTCFPSSNTVTLENTSQDRSNLIKTNALYEKLNYSTSASTSITSPTGNINENYKYQDPQIHTSVKNESKEMPTELLCSESSLVDSFESYSDHEFMEFTPVSNLRNCNSSTNNRPDLHHDCNDVQIFREIKTSVQSGKSSKLVFEEITIEDSDDEVT